MTITRPALSLPALYAAQHDAIYDPARFVVIEASTKAGKTAGCLIWLLSLAWTESATPTRIYWWIAPTYAQSRMAFDRLRSWLRQADPKAVNWSESLAALRLTLGNGATIAFKSADNADGLYGEDVEACVIDEATRCPEDAWYAIRSTLTATQGKARIIGNVRGRRNWVHAMALRADGKEVSTHKLTAWDAVAGGILSREDVESAQRDLPEAVFRELYLAEPADDGGNPFGIPALAACVAPLSTAPIAAWGVDLAKSHDWTVAVGVDADCRVVSLDRWQSDWGATIRRLTALIGSTPASVDSTGVGDPIVEELQRSLPNVESFKFTSQSKQQLMEGLAAKVQSGCIRFPQGWLHDELCTFEYEYSRTGVRYSAPSGMHDDGVCALALAVRSVSVGSRNTLEVRII